MMKVRLGIVPAVAVLGGVLGGQPLHALEFAVVDPISNLTHTSLTATLGDDYIAPQRSTLHQSVVALIETRMDAEKDATLRAFLSQLAGHYREFDARLHWVTKDGVNAEGAALLEELQRADRYGLNPAAFRLPTQASESVSEEHLAAIEADLSYSAILYAHHARGGRIDPSQLSLWLDLRPRGLYVSEVFRAIEKAGNAVVGLRSFHPHHSQFERLRQAYLAARGDIERVPVIRIPEGPELKVGDRHPDVALIRARLGYPASSAEDAELLDRALLRRIRRFAADAGYERVRKVDADVRKILNRPDPAGSKANKAKIGKLLVNMERWRLVPEDMGRFYVWNNLPEFQTRVVKGGEIVHQERIIVGKASTQTPVFNDEMSHVDFNPEWGVPESIKIRQLLPHLLGGDTGVLARRNMRVKYGEVIKDPSRVRWGKVDIRSVPIVQGPGPGNPLGRIKFMFPNSHSVYMHDTNDKGLFNSAERTFSHGCIRVRDPQRFAEIVLGEVNGWTPADVAQMLKSRDTKRIYLAHRIPVYNTYFTEWVNADGTITELRDIYGHDRRMADALNGKSIKAIAAADPALALKRENEALRENALAFVAPPPVEQAPIGLFGFLKPLPPPKPFTPYAKQGLGVKAKPVKKKYSSPAPPPRPVWFQER